MDSRVFVRQDQISTQWFEIEDIGHEVSSDVVLENLTPELFDHPEKGPEAADIEETWLRRARQPNAEPELRYRISVGSGAVGWFDAPVWHGGEIRGQWESLVTPRGKEFAGGCVPGATYNAVVEVWNTALRGTLSISETGEARLCVTHVDSTLVPW